jgi:hypothetical protein
MEMKRRWLVPMAVLAFILMSANASAASPDDPRALYDRAIAALGSPQAEVRAQAADLFSQAADRFEASAPSDYRAWYGAGTARALAGEPGLAIADFRRFLARDYFSLEAWENLKTARKAAGTSALGGEGLASWPWALWFAAAASLIFGLGVLLGGCFVFTRRRAFLKTACAAGILAVLLGLSSALSLAARPPLAIVLRETQGRKGDADVYAAQPAAPWKQGQEAWVIERRGNWVRIKVGPELSWVMEDSLEILPR